ncbi:N-acetylneuraminate synthase family protein [Candidatus Pelagibacter sp.]|nr:N-acetylneuraminate synthase family protein [Candidatus Pelagibacter sp.]
MNNNKFYIDNRLITNQTKPFLIAEVAQAHGGNIKRVFKFIDEVSKNNIDAIKFQTHISEFESTYDEPFRKKIKSFKSRYDYWKSMEFKKDEWLKIKKYCKKKKIIFLSSVFSIAAVKLLSDIGLKTWKIGSGECNSFDLLEYIKKKCSKDSVIISTGLMNNKRISEIYKFFNKKNPLCIMHCVSKYPAKFNELGLNNIDELNNKYNCIIGYSDHSGSVYSILYALSKSIPIIEFHVKINEDNKNLDKTSSIKIKDLDLITSANDIFFKINKSKINKKILSKEQSLMLKIFGKSLCFKKNMYKGQIVKKEDLTLKKPGTGINFKNMNKLIGKKISKNISSKRLIKLKDLI